MQIYGLKSCDTCRKAIKALPDAKFFDVRADGVPVDLLEAAFAVFDEALINTRSTTWRGLSEAERDSPRLALLQVCPALMKRPLIVAGDRIYLGWTPQVRQALAVA